MRSLTRPALGLLLALSLSALAPWARAFDMQSHRGGRALWPENTLAAFENAIRLGSTTLEMDAAITADGVVVVHHDRALNPATTRDPDGRWLTRHAPLIHALPLAELQRYDIGRLNPGLAYGREFPEQQPVDGQRIPTLASVFQLVERLGARDLRFDIETKLDPRYPEDTLAPEPFVDALLKVIREAGLSRRVMVQSFDWRTLELLHRKAPEVGTMYLTMDFAEHSTIKDGLWTAGHQLKDHGGSLPRMVRASAGEASGVIWAPHHSHLTPALLKEAHGLGLQVIPWTVNDKGRMNELIRWGVDGLISDHPVRLREAMAEQGLPLPRGVAR